MQKKIIALAVAGLVSGAAFAQSNVTIYGVVDLYVGHSSASTNTASGANVLNSGGLSGSRLGFKGEEALGNGMKVLWTYELGTLDPSSGDATNFNTDSTRQSFIGLAGNFGTVVAGRLQTPGYNFGAKYDAMGAGVLSPVGQLTDNPTAAGIGLSISGRDALARQNNSLAYVLPQFVKGLTVIGAYSFGTGGENVRSNAAGTNPQDIWALSADYDMGPLSVGYTHHNVNDFAGASGTDQTENAFGLNYDFGVAKFFGSYQRSTTDTAAAGDVAKVRVWNLGVRAPVGANGTVGFAYARLKDKDVGGAGADGKATSWGIDYQHALSKRTTAYVGYSRISNDNTLAYNLLNIGGLAGAGGKESQLIGGLRHTF